MNVFQKNIIRTKPNIIFNKRLFPSIDNEILEFAISNGLLQTDPNKLQELFSNEEYFSHIIKILDNNTLAMLVGSFPNIRDELLKTLKSSNIKIQDLPYSILEAPGVIKCLCKRNSDEVFAYFSTDSARTQMIYGFVLREIKNYILDNPSENIKQLETFLNAFNDTIYFTLDERTKLEEACIKGNIVISDEFPIFLKTNKIILNSILNVKSPNQMNNLKKTLQSFNLHTVYLEDTKAEEKTVKAIANKIREIGYIYDKNTSPQFMVSNNEFLYALIENNPYTIEELEPQKLKQIEAEDIKAKQKIVELLKSHNYIFSAKTPYFLISDSPELVLEALEMDFDNFEKIPNVQLKCSDEEAVEFLKKEYNIIKQHDPELSSKKYYLENPYVFKEAVQRGIYTINDTVMEYFVLKIPQIQEIASFLKQYYEKNNIVPGQIMKDIFSTVNEENTEGINNKYINNFKEVPNDFTISINMPEEQRKRAIESKKSFLTSIKNNIYTLYFHYEDYELTDSEKKEIAEIYLRGYPETLKNFLGHNETLPRVILKNPYIYYELLHKSPERRLNIDPIVARKLVTNQEIEDKVFEEFIQSNKKLSETSTNHEKSNKKIALKSIEEDPNTLLFISKSLYNDNEVYDTINRKIMEGNYKINKNTPDLFILKNYSKLKQNNFINIDEIIKQNPYLLKQSSNSELQKEVRENLPNKFKNKEITEDEFIQYLDAINFYDYDASEYADIIHSNPEIINKLSNIENMPIYNSEILAAVITELRENTNFTLDKNTFEKLWKSSDAFQDYILSERADLFPLLSRDTFFNTSQAVQTLSKTLINNNLNIPEQVKAGYFPNKLFRAINIQDYREIVDKLIANNPENIFIMSSFSQEQDYVLHERYKYLLESKKINYNMEKFKVPFFYNSKIFTEETVKALKANPNLINWSNIEINIYELTEDEKNIIKTAIKSSLDSSKELANFLKYTPEFYEDIINKDISFLGQLPTDFHNELYPLVEIYFSKNNIKYDENLPDFLKEFYRNKYIGPGYPSQSELERVSGSFFSDLIRSHPESVTKYADIAYNEGFIISDEDSIAIKTNLDLILSSIEKNPSYVYKISEQAIGIEYYTYEIIKAILNSSEEFEYNENLPEFLKNSTELFMHAITIDINNRKNFNENNIFIDGFQSKNEQIERTEEIKNIYLKNNIYLQDTSITILAQDPEYVFESLKNANKNDIQKIIDSIDLRGFDNESREKLYNMVAKYIDDGLYTFSDKSNPLFLSSDEILQKVILSDITILKHINQDDIILSIKNYQEIYNKFKINEKQYSQDKELMQFMRKNPYYIANQVLENLENIDNYNLDGIYIDDEIIQKISNKLLETNYIVTERTPEFLLINTAFLANYIKKQESIDGIPKKYVANLFRSDEIIKDEIIMEIYKYINNLQTPLTKYITFWGEESLQELYTEYGTLIKYLDVSRKYTLKDAKIYLENYMDNTNLSVGEICMFYTNLKLEVKDEFFKKHMDLCYSDEFIKFAIKQNPHFIFKYRGKNEDILVLAKDFSDVDSYILENNFASSTKLISALIEEKTPEYIKYYKGNDEKVVTLALENGLFENKEEKYINETLVQVPIIRNSDVAIKYLMENYDTNYIEQYTGENEEIVRLAIDSGYVPTIDKLLKNVNISKHELMIKEAIKSDVYCHGFWFKKYSESEQLNIVKQLLGSDIYSKIYEGENNNSPYTKIEREFLDLTSIIQTDQEGVKFLKLLNKDLINEVGFEEWKKIVKYSFKNKNMEHLHNILEKSEIQTLLKFISKISPLIKDDKALGVNKFLTITRFYDMNSDFCNSLLERLEREEKLTELELVNLETLIYRNSKSNIYIKSFNLEKLIEIEQLQLLDNSSNITNKNKIFTFLFNMEEGDVDEFLNKNINSKTIAQIRSRAIEENNKKLLIEADYMGIIVDIMENIKYNYSDIELNNIVNTLANAPQSQIVKIRKTFANIPEMTRHFYEIEAQEELTNIQYIIENNPELVTEYGGVKIVDLSNKKHTVYAHVYEGTNFHSFFNTDLGKVTICLSPETDKHEAYYYGQSPDSRTVMFFNNIPNGAYIGSSIENMGSNGFIEYNDYEVKSTKIYNQKSIRESYYGNVHPETLLYRHGLIPTGLIINKIPPSEAQIRKLNNLQEEVRKIKGHENDELYFIKTQGQKNRTINYKESTSEREDDIYLDEIEVKIQQLRKTFLGILNIDEKRNSFIRYLSERREKYSIINGEVFSEVNLTKKQQDSIKLAVELEKIVHQKNPKTVMKYREIKDDEKNKFLIGELTDSRTLWNLTRRNVQFSENTIEMLFKEFIIDHLMCNYSVGNNDFVLNPHNVLQPTNKNGTLINIEDFISNSGEPHTEMSYYYYDKGNNYGKDANNVYRKIFENYINNPEGNKVINEKIFEKIRGVAQTISKIPTDKYMEMFKDVLENIEDADERKKAEYLIRARKENIVEDTSDFIERIKEERNIAQNIEKIESADTVAIINDIHGNASALEEILKKCKQDGKKDVFVLGDMIGFGAESNECLDILRKKFPTLNIRCILGNHELYSLMGNSSFKGKLDLKELELTTKIRKDISAENRRFLESMPLTRKVEIEGKTIEFTHFPIKKEFENDNEMYLSHGSSLSDSSESKVDFVIYGHEHRTEYTRKDEVGDVYVYNTNNTTFINLPSSGCVHGNNTTYSVIDTKDDNLQVSVVPLSYDKERNDEAIRQTHNPYPHFFGTNTSGMGIR